MKEKIYKKKILYVVESFAGGVYQVVKELSNNLIDKYDIIIAYGKRDLMPLNFKNDFNNKISFKKIQNFTKNINIFKDIKAMIEIDKLIKIEKPDIIHLHSSKAGALGRLIKTQNNVKIFYSPHGFSFFKKDVKEIKRKVYWLTEKILSIINKKCLIIACSESEYKEALKLSNNSIKINNSVDTKYIEELTKYYSKNINWNNIKICTIGRIDYSKNPAQFNKIAEAFPNIKFKWIGDGNDELKKKLQSKNIEITGWLTEENVIRELQDEDIFILTSLWEGMPISLLEAMCCKKICIVSDVIGNVDVIQNKINGYIAKNTEEFINIIKMILKQRNDMVSKKAYEEVVNKYNIEKMIKKYNKIYCEEK